MLSPNARLTQGNRYYFNFDHFGLSYYDADAIKGDLASGSLPIELIGVYEHWVGDITIEFNWYGDAITVTEAASMFLDAMNGFWNNYFYDIRIKFNSASAYGSEATVNPKDDANKSMDDMFQKLSDLANQLVDNLPLVIGVLAAIVFINAGGLSAVKKLGD